MRTQRSDCEPECFQPSILTRKRPACETGISHKRGANMGRTYFRFSCHSSQRFQFLKQTQITLIPAGLEFPFHFLFLPPPPSPFLAAIQKLALPQIGSELPEGLRQAVLQLQIQFLRFKGGKSR